MTSTSTELGPSHSGNERFFQYFQQEVSDLQEQIERVSEHSTTGGESTDALEHCSAGIARLSNEVRDSLATLPAYDRQTYGDAIKALSTKLQTVKTQQSRKQKFSFKNSAFKIHKNESAVSLQDAAELARQRRADLRDSDNSSSVITTPVSLESSTPERGDGSGLADRKGEYILPTTASGVAADIQYSVLDLSNAFLPNFRLRNIAHSIIVIPHITGPIYLEGISNSIIVTACHQFRLHNSSKTEIYLHCSSRPIIEDCVDIRFAPLPKGFASERSESENSWDQIDDFKWLRAEQSPNWSILKPEQRREAEFWTTVKELRNEEDLTPSLVALKLP